MIDMIYELKESEFHRIEHMMEGDLINLEIKSVANRYNPGWIFVDNVKSPKSALVWSKGIEGFYFLGEENNLEFTDYLDTYITDVIISRAKNMGLNRFEFSGTSKEWDIALEKVFENRKLSRSKQFVYKHKNTAKSLKKQNKLPDCVSVRKVDEEFLRTNIENIDFVKEKVLEWWNTFEDYYNKGIGYCVISENTIVTSCISSFVSDDAMQSHIVTLEKYRKRGFAKMAVSEFLRYCMKNNHEPYWDCMETNVGSREVSESLGYCKDFEYRLYSFKI